MLAARGVDGVKVKKGRGDVMHNNVRREGMELGVRYWEGGRIGGA